LVQREYVYISIDIHTHTHAHTHTQTHTHTHIYIYNIYTYIHREGKIDTYKHYLEGKRSSHHQDAQERVEAAPAEDGDQLRCDETLSDGARAARSVDETRDGRHEGHLQESVH